MDRKAQIYSYLKTRYTAEDAREALYRAASSASDENWTLMDTLFQLGDKAREDGLDGEDAEKIIRRAFARERRARERSEDAPVEAPAQPTGNSLDLDPESRKWLESRRINPDDLMIPWPADDWRKDFLRLLEVAYMPTDTIEFKVAETSQIHRETVASILAQSNGIGKIMKSLDGSDGALITLNAVGNTQAREETWRFRYAVIDSPRMSLSKQLAYYKALNLPCVALVNSGANSVQAWVRIDAADMSEYNDRVDFLYATLEENGLKPDISLRAPTVMVRMPGVLRQGKQQYLIGLNEGAKSWKEWQEWVDYCLDGNPMVEQASYHKQAPSPDPVLVDGICRSGDFFLLQSPAKSGKSYALIDLALALVVGGEWMGRHCDESDVLYVNFDQTKTAFLNRIHEMASVRKQDPASSRLGILHLRGSKLTMQELGAYLVRRIEGARKFEDRDYKAVIIDPMHALLHSASTAAPGLDIQKMADQVTSLAKVALIMAANPEEVQGLQIQPDGILSLESVTGAGSDAFALTGRFKQFAAMDGKQVIWQHPRFLPVTQ